MIRLITNKATKFSKGTLPPIYLSTYTPITSELANGTTTKFTTIEDQTSIRMSWVQDPLVEGHGIPAPLSQTNGLKKCAVVTT